MTFSIVGHSVDAADGGTVSLGVAVASKFLAVGAAVPAGAADVGAIATQAFANLAYRPDGLRLLGEGRSAQETLDALTAADEGRDQRQAGVVDATGRSATFTGSGLPRLGRRTHRRRLRRAGQHPHRPGRRRGDGEGLARQRRPPRRPAADGAGRRRPGRRRPARPAERRAARRTTGRWVRRDQRRRGRPARRRPPGPGARAQPPAGPAPPLLRPARPRHAAAARG